MSNYSYLTSLWFQDGLNLEAYDTWWLYQTRGPLEKHEVTNHKIASFAWQLCLPQREAD